MCHENRIRFKRADEALRFYFRLRELLHPGPARRLVASDLPPDACAEAATAHDDYQCIGWCMLGLDEVALWLLSEIYGPTGFGVHRRRFSDACKAARLEFPGREFHVREIAMVHEHALGVVKRGLRKLAMIPCREASAARERDGVSVMRERAHLLGNRAATRA
jgi:hypothetical protein